MIDRPHLAQMQEQLYAAIPLVIPRAEMPSAIPTALAELHQALAAQRIVKTGPWFAHHLTLRDDVFDFEVCVPIAVPFKPQGRAVPGTWQAGTVARALFHGDYAGLPEAWEELGAWIKASGRQPAEHIYERYTVTPADRPDPSTWLTELNWPLLP